MGELAPLDHVAAARQHYRALLRVYTAWLVGDGLELMAECDPDFVRYQWTLRMLTEPVADLAGMATAAVGSMLSALHGVAKGLFGSVGCDVDAPSARVRFPLVVDEAEWDKELNRCIPAVSESGAVLLRSVQPFASERNSSEALATLYHLSDRGEPGLLSPFVVASFLETDAPDPRCRINALRTEVVEPISLMTLGAPVLVAQVYLSMGRDSADLARSPVPWSSGLTLDDPPRPRVELAFRGSDGRQVVLNDIKSLIHHVGQVVETFG